MTFDPTTKNFRIICRNSAAFDEIRNAFRVKNDAAFFSERYGFKAAEFLFAINKFGFFSPGLLFDILHWMKDTYGSLKPLAMSEKCKKYIDDYLLPLKSCCLKEFAISNISEDSGRNNELRHLREKQLLQGMPEKECVSPFAYRWYQEEAIKKFLFVGYGKGVIEVPTAGGKSFIIANFIWNVLKNINRNYKTLILVPNTSFIRLFIFARSGSGPSAVKYPAHLLRRVILVARSLQSVTINS